MIMKCLTTPIFYANDKPHLGHLYSVLIADIWKKGAVLFDLPALFVSGMDEHGQKVAISAKKQGYSPQEHVNKISAQFLDFFYNYDVVPEKWVRTTSAEHKEAVTHFWKLLKEKDYIYKGKYSGWYSISEEAYLLDASKNEYVHTQDVNIVWREEECYYFKLSLFEDKLKEFYKNNVEFIYPKVRYNEVCGFLNQGLKDFVISRPKSRLNWGIVVPDDDEHVIYVWFDALINYLSAIGYPNERYKKNWPAIHILGKDILKFHAIYWIAMLMAAEIDPPKKMLVHGWWMAENRKISKSLNNAVDLKDLSYKYQTDGIRYFLVHGIPLGNDGEFKEESIRSLVYSDLANKYGNLFLRILGMIEQFFNNEIHDYGYTDQILVKELDNIIENLKIFYDDPIQIEKYIGAFMQAVLAVDAYIYEKRVWQMEKKEVEGVLYFLLDIFRKISILAYPILPGTTTKILKFLNMKPLLKFYNLKLPQILSEARPILFPKNS